MSEKTENTLRQIGGNETREKIKNHLLWLRGSGKEEDRDFSSLDFTIVDPNDNWSNITIFRNSNISEANFQNSDIRFLDFSGAIMKGTDLRGSKYDIQQFSKEQIENVILTDNDYKKYQERKKLEEENKKLKKEVGEKTQTIDKIGEKQTDKLLKGFEDLRDNFYIEETRWLSISVILFFSLVVLIGIPILSTISYTNTYQLIYWGVIFIIFLLLTPIIAISKNSEKDSHSKTSFKTLIKENGWLLFFYILLVIVSGKISTTPDKIFDIKIEYAFIPLGILLSTFLYFTVYQYSKAKNLRIENQNKIAIIHGYQALRSEKGDGVGKTRFYDNIANVVFTSVYDKNEKHIEQNLPIDRIIDLVKTTIESTTKR